VSALGPPKRKRIRLDASHYAVAGSTWHVTISTADRVQAFADSHAAQMAVDTLEDRCAKAGANLLLYCVMPDHVHALIQIEHDDLISIVRAVKSILGIWWKKQLPDHSDLWQRSFFDRGIRSERDMASALSYVFRNPIDDGLVSDWTEYKWIGGTLIERP
jgi:putative transposase